MIIRDLGDNLILRNATPADADALVTFNSLVHRDHGVTEPDAGIAAWTRDLMERPHPTFLLEDFTVVEDTRRGAIVSSLNLISQTWTYDGIPFGMGRIELVGTDPEYRRRGLVRQQFDVVHEWSRERGELAQGITGIPWYYRQFGYEYALELDGGRGGAAAGLPAPVEPDKEPYRVRPATPADLPFMMRVEAVAGSRSLVSAVRDAALWRYRLDGMSNMSGDLTALQIIETAAGDPAGYIGHRGRLRRDGRLAVTLYELRPGVPWRDVTVSVLRYLRATGEEYAARDGGSFDSFMFYLDMAHPVGRAVPERLPRVVEPYAWYIRVPDLPAFIQRIAPALEQRLSRSEAAGYSGELRLCFFRDGLRLVFERGRLTAAEPWPDVHFDTCSVAFPDLTFLQLLFGHRSLAELRYAFADCIVRQDEAGPVLNVLFPKQTSFVIAIL